MMRDYFLNRARGIVLEYIRGVRRGVSLNWVIGSLVKMVERNEISVAEIWSIINEIENNPRLYLLDRISGRRERLEELKSELKRVFSCK